MRNSLRLLDLGYQIIPAPLLGGWCVDHASHTLLVDADYKMSDLERVARLAVASIEKAPVGLVPE